MSSGERSRPSRAAAETSAAPRTDRRRLDDAPFLPATRYAVTGDKHFGSGSGVTDRMITTAVPDGETDPTIFVLDVRGPAVGRHRRPAR